MDRPTLEDSQYWSKWNQGDGKRTSYCLHELYQNDLNSYIDWLLKKTDPYINKVEFFAMDGTELGSCFVTANDIRQCISKGHDENWNNIAEKINISIDELIVSDTISVTTYHGGPIDKFHWKLLKK